MTCITKFEKPSLDGFRSDGCSYPESERAYFKRVYGSDRTKQLHDDEAWKAICRYSLPNRSKEIVRIHNQLDSLTCSNSPVLTAPGRSGFSLALLKENLQSYLKPQWRSLRWNQHYQKAISLVAKDVKDLLKGKTLNPIGIDDVAGSDAILRNREKNAGYIAFETGERSKGENLEEAQKWCTSNMAAIAEGGYYGLPLVISHRSSNAKPKDERCWKAKSRIILMQDVRALLLDGRFALPFTQLFNAISWGEGSMTHQEVQNWVDLERNHYSHFYSTDYSSFDVSQPAWLLEDVFEKIVRPCFGELSEQDEKLFKAMENSYIHKEIHSFDGIYYVHGCQLSGSLTTYAYNTIINQIIDLTALLVQGHNVNNFKSLKCGDDNLTFYNGYWEKWDGRRHAQVIYKLFGIRTTYDNESFGRLSEKDPIFLSRTWTRNGAERDINEVIWNLIYPERFRRYDEEVTGVSKQRAAALLLNCAVLEQPSTMRKYFDVEAIERDAGVSRRNYYDTYQAVENLGSGFIKPWIRYKYGYLKRNVAA